jgi:myosin-5
VRCIKPNGKQQASDFDQGLIHHQLRCCGVLEVARIAQAGYPTRYAHTDFVYRYRLLLPGMPQGPLPAGLSPLDVCKRLLSHLGVDPSLYQIGRTKLFFRAGVLGRLEDRVIRINKAVLVIQSTWRMAVDRRKFLEVKAAATLIAATWRGRLGRRKAAEQRRQRNAAIFIQSVWRSYATRKEYRVTREAVLCIQHCWRRLQARRELRARFVLRQEEERSAAEQAAIRFSEQESYEALKQEFGVDGAYVREVLTVWREHGERFQEYLESIEGTECNEGVYAEQRFEPNETLKLYVAELEEEVEELRSQLQAQAQAHLHQASLEERLQHRGIETDRSHYSDTSVSIMSYSNDESVSPIQMKRHNKQTDQPGTTIDIAATAVSAEAIGPRPAIPTVRFGRAGPEGAVAALQAEMVKKSALFDDDASFIREVHEGISLAPSMNPHEEIDRLIYRYKAWQRDFKARLKSTQETLRRSQYSSENHHRASSSRAPTAQRSLQDGKASPRFNEGGLTARLMTFARGSRQRLVNNMSQ